MLYTEEAIMKRKQQAQKVKKTVSIVAYILLIPLLVYNISLMVQAVVNPQKTPSFIGIKTYSIISGSMEPEIQIGDIVIVKEVPEEEIKEGDVISFREGQTVVTHRVIEVQQDEEGKIYKTKGDNNNVEDGKNISFSIIEGKVVSKIPFIGKISNLLQGKIIIIVITFLVYIYFSHLSKVSSRRNRRRIKRMKYEENLDKESESNNEN